MTPTERRALHHAAIVEAWDWIDTYCPHYATQGRDWQTTDNMSAASRVMAKRPTCRLDDIKHGRLHHKTHSHCRPADHYRFADRRPDTASGAGCRMG